MPLAAESVLYGLKIECACESRCRNLFWIAFSITMEPAIYLLSSSLQYIDTGKAIIYKSVQDILIKPFSVLIMEQMGKHL
jgi:hypothetical protein